MGGNGCSFCGRELTDVAHENNLVYPMSMTRLLMPGRGRTEGSWWSCEDCFEEITELEPDLNDIDVGVASDDPTEEYWSYDECSFCERALSQERAYFGYATEWKGEDMIDRDYIVCLNCCDVITEFLSNIPESPKEGDVYVGVPDDDIDTSVDEADHPTIKNRHNDCDTGDYIQFEVHHYTNERTPNKYTVAEGEVINTKPDVTGRRITVSSFDNSEYDEYDLDRTISADPDHPISVQARSGETTERLGNVTVFEIVD